MWTFIWSSKCPCSTGIKLDLRSSCLDGEGREISKEEEKSKKGG
jgi:hypothetical protein